jgi:hypothetical protein
MEMNSISGSAVAAQMLPAKAVDQKEQPVKTVLSAHDQLSTVAVSASNPSTTAKDKVTTVKKPVEAPVAAVLTENKPNHVFVTYNQQGEVRTKFMDSNNNVIYQIPTELVAKMEDQMMKLNSSTSVKG